MHIPEGSGDEQSPEWPGMTGELLDSWWEAMIDYSGGRMEVAADLLMEALRVAEAHGWHHSPLGTLEGDHYNRLVTMLRWQELMIDGVRARGQERH